MPSVRYLDQEHRPIIDGRLGRAVRRDLLYGADPHAIGPGPGGTLRELGTKVAADLPGVGANLADHPTVPIDFGYAGRAQFWGGGGASAPALARRSPCVPPTRVDLRCLYKNSTGEFARPPHVVFCTAVDQGLSALVAVGDFVAEVRNVPTQESLLD